MAKVQEPRVTKGKRRAGQLVGYLRVSTLDQKELRQLDGVALDKRFVDKASGKDLHRPELDQLTSYVREGDTVICHSMDRLARNLEICENWSSALPIGVSTCGSRKRT